MSLRYTLSESFSGFTRAKLSSLLSIVTIAISLLLLGVFTVLTVNTSRFIEALRNRMEFEAFLQEPLTRADTEALAARVRAIPGVDSVVYVSKEDAARIFRQEFGEDINTVLDFNPLPPSFKIYLRDGFKTAAQAQRVFERVQSLDGVDHVIYRKALLELIDRQTASVNNLTLGLGVLVGLSALFLVSNTIRLAIYAKRRLLRTMELVGATSGFIRLPFLLEGIIQGFVGGLLAAGILFLLLEFGARLVSPEFPGTVTMPPAFYPAVVLGGIALGLLGSTISVARFLGLARTA
jgi:cell division transport system permease protein